MLTKMVSSRVSSFEVQTKAPTRLLLRHQRSFFLTWKNLVMDWGELFVFGLFFVAFEFETTRGRADNFAALPCCLPGELRRSAEHEPVPTTTFELLGDDAKPVVVVVVADGLPNDSRKNCLARCASTLNRAWIFLMSLSSLNTVGMIFRGRRKATKSCNSEKDECSE